MVTVVEDDGKRAQVYAWLLRWVWEDEEVTRCEEGSRNCLWLFPFFGVFKEIINIIIIVIILKWGGVSCEECAGLCWALEALVMAATVAFCLPSDTFFTY